MRILIATTNRNLVGGLEKYLQGLMPGLLDRGHDLRLLHEKPADPQGTSIDPSGVTIPAWCPADSGVSAALSAISNWKPDVIYSHGLESASLEEALLKDYPSVLYAHNYYGTCPTGRKCHNFPTTRPCDRTLGPMCLLLHYPRRCGGLNPATAWRMYKRQSLFNSRLASYQNVLVASHHMYREFARNGVSADKLRLIPLPATDSTPLLHAPTPRNPSGHILFVGRLTDLKGVHYLIDALPRAAGILGRELRLTIAGDGPDRPKLEHLARRLGVAADFRGWVQTAQKLELIRRSDLLAVPSLWPEPFALVGIEAASLGVPAVGYAVGGIPDWLLPNQTGELAPGDPPTAIGLAEAIARALASPDHYQSLCRVAWENAKRFTLREHLTQLEPILVPRKELVRFRLPLQTAGPANSSASLETPGTCAGDNHVS
jgi:glycosyltransferase involved in cell wall biosynthesis